MVLASFNKVKKYFGDRLILDIDKLEILESDRIGLVGENGAGKTTLIKTLLGICDVEEGQIYLTNSYAYISQREDYIGTVKNSKLKSVLNAPGEYEEYLSGGEKVKLRISEALSENKKLVIADEPTSNLDRGSIKVLEDMFKAHRGAMLLVSHDREFLDALCNIIIEIEEGKLKFYKGNYSKYVELKAEEKERQSREYEGYVTEKRRLEEAVLVKQGLRDSIRKAPRRMGNSEARLHKMGDQKAKSNLEGNIKALRSRIEHLEVKERPKTEGKINIRVSDGKEIVSKNVIEVKDLFLMAGEKNLFNGVSFKVKRGKKTAIIGGNGKGKTTLLKVVLSEQGIKNSDIEARGDIRINNKVVVGYFDQSQDILKDEKTILENIMEDSAYDQSFIRINLDGFGFKGEQVHKQVGDLSGGERVKVALCKILLGDNNVLVLDEPTNYLDIKSMEALEEALSTTDKTVLIVSHDRKFISNVCDYILDIENETIKEFNGTYEEYLKEKNKPIIETEVKINREQLMVLENRLSEVISLLSIEKSEEKKEEKLKEYNILLKQVNELRKKVR
ncbi:ABC-F type ribosomal protection protein CplR [Clostridium culturomicium]|uniref:ABC-F type ribosomal protection protein CplR n=1 Tax=Clostridium culturomicium TaxID=1499683 RepID=UPI0038575977